ncbi:uncharacterized protein MKK02DRAFT_39962 [Dioszegia hungarica]|uniref:Transmembrane protein n=1 Tax=Dioszegia hungarica TaxID=4972 RepID=A0AA38HI01_9TREE|nr:uncharacterized protein MKK02DRAFT_39962 [Dioszegia hungarica]KAI9639639.1 hypothetical protein MKK02DRAFT_39962 [Dioszegia hungarica]
MSTSNAASLATSEPTETGGASPNNNVAFSFATSKIIRFTIAAGIIVLAISAVFAFFKIGKIVRSQRRKQRQKAIAKQAIKEDETIQFEVAAWATTPGHAPVGRAAEVSKEAAKRRKKQRERDVKVMRRKGGNAYMVDEWEGVAQ